MVPNVASRARFGGPDPVGRRPLIFFLMGWTLVAAGLLAATLVSDAQTRSLAGESPLITVAETFSQLPLSFEPNLGQTDDRVEFLSRGQGYTLFLTPTGAVLSLKVPTATASDGAEDAVGSAATTALGMHLLGSNPEPRVRGMEELPGKVNYFIGNDPAKWRTNVPVYARVDYQEVYPGVDLVYYGNQGLLEYDFIVAPGADPSAILLGFEGADNLVVDGRGDLIVRLAGGEIMLRKPLVYQDVGGTRHEVPGGYWLEGEGQVSFQIGPYDATSPLVIDPVIIYFIELGGSGLDTSSDIAVDASGNTYVMGTTTSPDFPTANPLQGANAGSRDAFLTKVDPGGSIVYSTYLGGSDSDQGRGMALDSAGDLYLVGATDSPDFPTVNPSQPSCRPSSDGSCDDAFVAKLNASGSALIYSTYLGGGDNDSARDVALAASGNVYITGTTRSKDFPTTAGAFNRSCGTDGLCNEGDRDPSNPRPVTDTFVTGLSADGSEVLYSTYLGGARS